MPSIKNFQLILKNNNNNKNDEDVFLQFGKINDLEFNLDFKYPISPIQAFSIALSCYDNKLFYE